MRSIIVYYYVLAEPAADGQILHKFERVQRIVLIEYGSYRRVLAYALGRNIPHIAVEAFHKVYV